MRERRLVWRVLRHWREIANGGRFPCRDEIEPWMRGEDGVNCLLITVESPIELSHFLTVGMSLGIALCPTDTLAGVLLSHLARVVVARRSLMITGVATLRGIGILYRRAAPALRGRNCDRPRVWCGELSLATCRRGADDADHFPPFTDGATKRQQLTTAAGLKPHHRALIRWR
jgi:hypothetical protein